MSKAFRVLLQKIGSGTHTSEHLSRSEAADAMRMMLLQEATPAQIGAFLIAHRIKRPTGEEMAGMLDAYDQLGPVLPPLGDDRRVLVMGSPYDGRSRTASLSPLTALVLATAGNLVLLHGGDVMPTKAGIPLVQTWQALGVDWTRLTLDHVWNILNTTGVGFIYLPTHFPLAQGLVQFRDEIGKRPPLATLELIWSAYRGPAHIITGYVHPPTEAIMRTAFALRHTTHFTTVKGLEGSCDLPRDRTAIIGISDSPPTLGQSVSSPSSPESGFLRLHLHPRDYGVAGKNIPLDDATDQAQLMQSVLAGVKSEGLQSVVWNSGFYLWRSGTCPDVASGMALAEDLITKGRVLAQLHRLQAAIAHLSVSASVSA
ncbi:MAG: anthranilate phosphoribosyltransferase family protein [Cyanobacteria bacterium]|nr:anthranilate phosphoribosyltransferase family protein [Cyanobacteriota bacterium]MDW8201450.1 anthranilate phosphoribosyltransferase family protein [Cyanobacteriota bacterium SKYGB_h_bin112]